MANFAHLHSHTLYSTLDGVASPEQYAAQCGKLGIAGMAITEHGHMGSVPDCYFAFKKQGIAYVAGCEIYYNDYEPVRRDLESKGIKYKSADWKSQNPDLAVRIARNRHLTVLCKNQTGFENLIKLTTEAYEDGLYGGGSRKYNRIWFEKLAKYREGLIILSGCLNGPVAFELRHSQLCDSEDRVTWSRSKREQISAAAAYIKKFKEVFGEDYYVELQMPGIEGDVEVFYQLVTLAEHFKLKVALANDSHYLDRKDHVLQKIMMAISQETTVDSPDLFHVNSDEQYLKTRDELYETFMTKGYSDKVPEHVFHASCDNTLEILSKCEPLKTDDTIKIPRSDDDAKQLKLLVAKRLKDEGLHKVDKKYTVDGREVTYVQQAQIELDRFIDKGFASYFIITRNMIEFGRNKGFPFNPRGCSTPESKVTMADGQAKEIANVEVGDKVLDGFGNTQLIENKFIYDVSEELINIELDNTILKVTCDHKFYIIRDMNVMLLKASELKDTDEIISPCLEERANHEDNSSQL